MGKIRKKALGKDGWKEFALTEKEHNYIKTILNTRDAIYKSYDELVGRFLAASVGPRVGMETSVEFEMDPDDAERKIKMRPAPVEPG